MGLVGEWCIGGIGRGGKGAMGHWGSGFRCRTVRGAKLK